MIHVIRHNFGIMLICKILNPIFFDTNECLFGHIKKQKLTGWSASNSLSQLKVFGTTLSRSLVCLGNQGTVYKKMTS